MPHRRQRDAVRGGERRRIDHVHRIHRRAEKAGDGRGDDRVRVQPGGLAVELDADRDQVRAFHLPEKGAELAPELHIGFQDRRLLGRDRGHVQRVGDGAIDQEIGHLLGHLKRHLLLRLGGAGAKMRRRHNILHAEQRILARRLAFEHIQRRARHMAVRQCRRQRQLVDKPAARAIDDPHALFGAVQRVGRQDVAGLFGQRRMQADEIGRRQQLVKLDLLDPDPARMFRRQERVIGDDLHLQPLRAVGDDGADIAAADDAQNLAGDLGAHEARFLPFAGLRRFIRRRDLPRQRQDHRDGVLGRRHGIAIGGVHHHDAARRRFGNIDIVDADAGPPDNLQLRRRVEDLACHLGRRADRQPVIPADDGGKLGRLQPGLHIHLDPAGLEDFDGLRAELVTDKYFRHGSAPFRGALSLCMAGADQAAAWRCCARTVS